MQTIQLQGFAQQWFLSGQPNGATPLAHVNLLPVWAERVFGRGIVMCVIDDGVNFMHPDLVNNYNAGLSYDYINNDNDPSPVVRSTSNHGTPVASTCCGVNNRAVANNGATAIDNECGVGAAPQATLAAVRDLNVNSDVEVAQVVTHRLDNVDVYILTAGPPDDGRTAQPIGSLAQAAFLRGVTDGRNRLGSIYMYSAGNGGQQGDDCNFDGFVSFRATVAVGAITSMGEPTYYSEECSALHVVTPSTGYNNMISGGISGMFVAAYQGCFDRFGGTSGAAPLAAGVVALWLSAVPTLNWLDVQGVLAYSSSRRRTAVAHTASWAGNGAGLYYSHWFGFGVIDAQRGLAVARAWQSYSLSSLGTTDSGTLSVNRNFSFGDLGQASWNSGAPSNKRAKAIEVYVTLRHQRRGDLRLFLTSPFGTQCQLARARPRDSARDFNNYRFTCNAMWDESPAGMWQLRVEDTKVNPPGTLVSWRVVIYHTDPNNFSEKGSRPIQVDTPPPAPTPSVIVITQSTAQSTPSPMADAVPVTLIAASSDRWRFRLGPLHDAESMSFRFADVEYGERDGPNGDKWLDGAAPFGFGLDEERNGLVFATKFALNSTSAIFRKVVFLSAAQISVISRFRISCASDDYATVFFNGIPVFGESPPVRPRNYAYWNDEEEFGRVIVRQGPNVVAVRLYNGATSSDMVMDLQLEALVFAGSSFPAPMPVPTPAPTPFVPPVTRTMFVPVTDTMGAPVTGTDGMVLTTVVVNTLPEFSEMSDEMPAPESIAMANLFSLETGVPYLLFIIVGIAVCLFCSIIILGMVFLRSRRRRGGRRRINRQRSKTRIGEYDRVLDQEMRKQTRAEPVAANGKKSGGADGKKSGGNADGKKGGNAEKPLPKAPSDRRPLPELKPGEEPKRDLPPLKKPVADDLVSARDSPVQVRRKTVITQPVNPATPTAPPADDDDDDVVVVVPPKEAAKPAAANPGTPAQGSPVPNRRKTVVTQPVNPATPANASPVGTPVMARRELGGGASQGENVAKAATPKSGSPVGTPGQVRRATASNSAAAEPVKMLYVDLDQSATLRESSPPQYINVDDFDDLPPPPRDLDNEPPPAFAEQPKTRAASQTAAPRPNPGLAGSRAHSATAAPPVARVASPLARATSAAAAADTAPEVPEAIERPETPPPPPFSAEAAPEDDESFDDELPGLPDVPPPDFDESAV